MIAAIPAPAAQAAIRAPAGFRSEIFARGLRHPTALAFGPGGRLFVTEDDGRIVSVRPGGSPVPLVAGLRTPLGLAWRGRDLFVSDTGRILRLTVRSGRVTSSRTILSGLPHGRHQQDNIVLGPDGRLYFGSGSTCNACRERDRRSAAILSMRPDGSGLRIVARGLRNPYGLAFRPGTRELYASVNGRDDLDRARDPEPAEMFVRVRQGDNFGWPACWPSARLLRLVGRCSGVRKPVAYLEPHGSADGFAFWRGDVYLAEWGTYFGSRFGRRVVRISGSRVSVFASGFLHPLAVTVDPRGGLLVADWGRGVIYRIVARRR